MCERGVDYDPVSVLISIPVFVAVSIPGQGQVARSRFFAFLEALASADHRSQAATRKNCHFVLLSVRISAFSICSGSFLWSMHSIILTVPHFYYKHIVAQELKPRHLNGKRTWSLNRSMKQKLNGLFMESFLDACCMTWHIAYGVPEQSVSEQLFLVGPGINHSISSARSNL